MLLSITDMQHQRHIMGRMIFILIIHSDGDDDDDDSHINNNHFLSACHVLGTLLSTLCGLSH